MADETKRVHVRIANVAYQLAANENETHIRQMAANADEMIRRVLQSSPQLSQGMATVLALVNAMDEISLLSSQAEIERRQRESLERQLVETKVELSRIREQNWEMKKDMLKMQNLLAEFEQHLDKLKHSEIDSLGKPKRTAMLPEMAEDDDDDDMDDDAINDAFDGAIDGVINDDDDDDMDDDAIDDAIGTVAREGGPEHEKTAPPTLQSYEQTRLEDYL